ncbi:cation:proton antiporter domain-containing protein [Nocardia sp. NBC_01327]|uniref:cation:proton antiporter domain-containing protein n=1 Tax=Nocardia sp. NBC_01327 TaxID=2903593 RepID=UPI002E13B271|nr:cation:proton antiporter [Nocardia sp. NBC_01327]
MTDVDPFALVLLIASLVGLAAVLSSRLGAWIPIPAPALFLVGAAVASDIWPRLGEVPVGLVERVVTVALVIILFDGGMQIGWRSLRTTAGPIVWIGVVGTVCTAAALAACAHFVFGLDWRLALLLGTALSPTDPAVVFSVLGRREITGRSGVLLQGESGANDPVGIALMVVLLGSTTFHASAVASAVGVFTTQMLVGAAVGGLGGAALLWFMRRIPLPAAGLYSVRVLMCALAIYGLATLAHGSGFLAVLVAGVVLGDRRAPFKAEIVRFHSALANLAEIVAFIMLGLTIQLTGGEGIAGGGAWVIGLGLAVLLAFVIRPVVMGALLWRVDLTAGERWFVLWTGLKGAVPILLGTFIIDAGVSGAHRTYEIIFVVVAFSVIVQGAAVPFLARRLGVPVREVNPRPWGLGVRFEHEPVGLHRLTVAADSEADGMAVADLPSGAWVSVIIRRGHMVPVTAEVTLRAGDEVLLQADPEAAERDIVALFTR